MKESELAQHFIDHFEGFDIYKEVNVPYGGICDIVLKMGKMIIGIEVKCSFNLPVIYQANRNKDYCHYSYVAVPRPSQSAHYRNSEAEALCEALGIGVLYYSEKKAFYNHLIKSPRHDWCNHYSNIGEAVKPLYRRFTKTFTLHEWQKRSVAGSVCDRLTEFKITVEEIHAVILKHGGRMPVKQVFNQKWHYASINGAKQGILNMIRAGVITDFYLDNGHLCSSKKQEQTSATPELF